jgi:NADH-quinone oxidoreductase subunit K
MANLEMWLILSALLFSVGVYGVITRRNAVALLLAIELMVNAVNINLAAFGWARGDYTGQMIALFAIAMTVAEVAVGLAILISLSRTHKSTELDVATELM